MKVFLANPPWILENRWGVRAGSRWPHTFPKLKGRQIPHYVPFPFFLAYAAAVLEKEGFEICIVDAIAEGMDDNTFINKIIDFSPQLVFLETSTPSIDTDLSLAARIKKELGVTIAIGGPHVSFYPEQTLQENTFIDYVLIGEYEYTLLELVRCIKQKGDPAAVKGLAYRYGVTERRALIENLDELPWPARHLLPMPNYKDASCGMPEPLLLMWASRGCPYKCIFCMWPKVMYGGSKYRVRNPVYVIDEVEHCVEKYGIKCFYFDDDTFNIGKERILMLIEEIKKRKLGIPWSVMARADIMDAEILENMASSGIYSLKYGVESAEENILKTSGKGLDFAKVKETIRQTKSFGIKVHLTFTLGLPGETEETIKKTLEFAKQMDPDTAQFSICTPFPGTEYYEMAKEKGFLHAKEWKDFDGNSCAIIQTDTLTTRRLEELLIELQEEWGRHHLFREFRKNKWPYIVKGLKSPIKTIKFLFRK